MCRSDLPATPSIELPAQLTLLPPTQIKSLAEKKSFTCKNAQVYEIGSTIREGKFSSIRHGTARGWIRSQSTFLRNNHVAIKMYQIQDLPDVLLQSAENPWKEIEIHKYLPINNLNLVPLIDSLILDHQLLMVTPYYSGGDLMDQIEATSHHRLSIQQMKRLCMDVLNGLKGLHDSQIVHRDLSVENIFYDKHANSYAIGDFGMAMRINTALSKQSSSLFLYPSVIYGKDAYNAPELWRGAKELDLFACDIWSCGIIFFMCLTGFAPLQRANEHDIYYQTYVKHRKLAQMINDCCGSSSSCLLETEDAHDCLEMIQWMLDPEPSHRPTVDQLLHCSWMLSNSSSSSSSLFSCSSTDEQ